MEYSTQFFRLNCTGPLLLLPMEHSYMYMPGLEWMINQIGNIFLIGSLGSILPSNKVALFFPRPWVSIMKDGISDGNEMNCLIIVCYMFIGSMNLDCKEKHCLGQNPSSGSMEIQNIKLIISNPSAASLPAKSEFRWANEKNFLFSKFYWNCNFYNQCFRNCLFFFFEILLILPLNFI